MSNNTFMTSISFKEYYLEQLVYLEMQHSKSNFICELIKQHMLENGFSIPTEEIEKYIDCKKNKKKYNPQNKQSFSFNSKSYPSCSTTEPIENTPHNEDSINTDTNINIDANTNVNTKVNTSPEPTEETIETSVNSTNKHSPYQIDDNNINFFLQKNKK